MTPIPTSARFADEWPAAALEALGQETEWARDGEERIPRGSVQTWLGRYLSIFTVTSQHSHLIHNHGSRIGRVSLIVTSIITAQEHDAKIRN